MVIYRTLLLFKTFYKDCGYHQDEHSRELGIDEKPVFAFGKNKKSIQKKRWLIKLNIDVFSTFFIKYPEKFI